MFQLEDASTGLAVPLNSEIETDVQDEEMAQSAHLMTLGLCRISSTKCPPQTASSVKRLSHIPGEQDAENNIMDDRQPLLLTGEMQKPSEEDGLVCILCQTVTSSRSMLEVHLKCHSGDQGFRCLHCDWESEDWLDMEQHWRGHGKKKNSKPHKCSVCPKAFRRADSRDAHEKRHNQRHRCRSEPTPLAQCSLCLEWCHSGTEWEIHQQCHFQGEFKCLHCDFTGIHNDIMTTQCHPKMSCYAVSFMSSRKLMEEDLEAYTHSTQAGRYKPKGADCSQHVTISYIH